MKADLLYEEYLKEYIFIAHNIWIFRLQIFSLRRMSQKFLKECVFSSVNFKLFLNFFLQHYNLTKSVKHAFV